jgi:hypothetical protein
MEEDSFFKNMKKFHIKVNPVICIPLIFINTRLILNEPLTVNQQKLMGEF